LIERCTKTGDSATDFDIDINLADSTLRRVGVIVNISDMLSVAPHSVTIANQHGAMQKIMLGTPWAGCWPRTLLRLPGAQKREVRKFAGVASRGVDLPLTDLE